MHCKSSGHELHGQGNSMRFGSAFDDTQCILLLQAYYLFSLTKCVLSNFNIRHLGYVGHLMVPYNFYSRHFFLS
jgi:hypothetical protein